MSLCGGKSRQSGRSKGPGDGCAVCGHLMGIDKQVRVVVTFSPPSLYQRPSGDHGYV